MAMGWTVTLSQWAYEYNLLIKKGVKMLPVEQLQRDWLLILVVFIALAAFASLVFVAFMRCYAWVLRWFGFKVDEYEVVDIDEADLLKYMREKRQALDISRSVDENGF